MGLTTRQCTDLKNALVGQCITNLGSSTTPRRDSIDIVAYGNYWKFAGAWRWWQLAGSALVVFFAMAIAGMGLWLAYLHLRSQSDSATKLLIGKIGIEISSKVIGLVILVIAYFFFQTAAHYAFTLELVGQ